MKNLQVGTRVHCILYGGRDGMIYSIHGEQTPNTCRSIAGGVVVMGGSAYLDIVWENGSESRGIPESLVRTSVQWRVLEGIASAAEILAARGLAILENQRKADEKEERQRVFDAAVAALRADSAYKHLQQTSPAVYASAKLAAANIRAELKKAFPGVKFSVTSSTFSMGDSVSVRWTAGPTEKEVEEIADKYSAGSFDGMQDLYNYAASPWTTVFGDAKYIHCSRRTPQPGDAEYEALKAKIAALEGAPRPATTDDEWELRVRAYEAEGMTRSDAQSVVDVEFSKEGKPRP